MEEILGITCNEFAQFFLSGIPRRILFAHTPECFNHRSFLRNISISVEGGKCQHLLRYHSWQRSFVRAPFADEGPISTRSFNKFKSSGQTAVDNKGTKS